ncbi:bifunctional metallophosphatase/5'-nucleotidase [Candidatus Aerophobetes bacterium]|uniref:Bifunctional metallophosphatase/5'-nucleotidase n=1 Tax=Aerophobetes bacterium TaxID=2030807 RepID=A0A523UQT2_UNCAE|nr:MAG: bifunctional metallophosphatase/5'-nucleotidase [Candidatus Aerophobetes bacterium]
MSFKKAHWLVVVIASGVLTLLGSTIGLAGKGNLTILHTNDMHSHLGEFSRLATKIKEIKEVKARENEPVLLLDSGDFLIGTLYHLLTPTLSPELTLMNTLEYHATTLGNHEFEWGPQALAKLIDIARTNGGGSTVPIVASNTRFNSFDPRDDDLKKLYDAGAIRPYLVKDLSNGLKVGIIGLLGKGAKQEALRAAPLRFRHNTEFIQHIVNIVRRRGVDLLILLSHSGLDEDKKLAKLVKGIDIIIAGHCNTALLQPIHIGNTLIVEAGSYTKYLGKLEVYVEERKVSLRNYQLIPIDDTIPKNEAIQAILNDYISVIDKEILNPMGLASEIPLAETGFDLTRQAELINGSNLGDLVADGMRFAIDRSQPEDSVDFIFQPTGFIRDNVHAGIVKTSDAFRIVPLGIGPDMEPGYPLVSFYLNAHEIKRILEISTYLSSSRGRGYLFQVSGLRFWYNPLRSIFRKVTRIERWGRAVNQYVPVETWNIKSLYKVGTNLLLVDILPLIRRYVPWLAIIPKDKEGNPIPLRTSAGRKKILVDGDLESSGIQELKEWQAFIGYLSHLPDRDGDSIPDIPLQYAKSQGRINRPSEEVLSYQAQRKSLWIGVGAALIFPSLGHLYAENWYPRGLAFLLMESGSLVLASRESTKIPGLLALIALKLWECKDAYETVMDYNKQLAEKYHISFSANQDKACVSLSYTF